MEGVKENYAGKVWENQRLIVKTSKGRWKKEKRYH